MKNLTRLAVAAALVAAAAAACSDATGPKLPTEKDGIDTSNPKGGGGDAYVAPAAPVLYV